MAVEDEQQRREERDRRERASLWPSSCGRRRRGDLDGFLRDSPRRAEHQRQFLERNPVLRIRLQAQPDYQVERLRQPRSPRRSRAFIAQQTPAQRHSERIDVPGRRDRSGIGIRRRMRRNGQKTARPFRMGLAYWPKLGEIGELPFFTGVGYRRRIQIAVDQILPMQILERGDHLAGQLTDVGCGKSSMRREPIGK